jgi:hypothetical protein
MRTQQLAIKPAHCEKINALPCPDVRFAQGFGFK